MIEALEKLRGCVIGYTDGACRAIADEIEAELEERYMELPLDADGVPIHPGDELVYRGHEPFVCRAVSEKHAHTWDAAARAIGHLGTKCVHVKPRTVKDVLEDFASDPLWEAEGSYEGIKEKVIEKYAAELQMKGERDGD